MDGVSPKAAQKEVERATAKRYGHWGRYACLAYKFERVFVRAATNTHATTPAGHCQIGPTVPDLDALQAEWSASSSSRPARQVIEFSMVPSDHKQNNMPTAIKASSPISSHWPMARRRFALKSPRTKHTAIAATRIIETGVVTTVGITGSRIIVSASRLPAPADGQVISSLAFPAKRIKHNAI